MEQIRLPSDHPARAALAAEVHARPPVPAVSPAVISSFALLEVAADEVYARLRTLAAGQGVELAAQAPTHLISELPGLRAVWERHGEFVRLTFVRPLPQHPLGELDDFPSAFSALPADWLETLPGLTIAATDVALLPNGDADDESEALARWFASPALAGAEVLDGSARIFTDFIAADEQGGSARTRWLVLDGGMGPARSARLVQRLLEIETYRMLALLALPLARAAIPSLDAIEQRLAEITAATAGLQGTGSGAQHEERRLLDELTRIAADVEHSAAETAFRFSAGQAYWELVRSRVAELREQRIGDTRTIGGFLSRRLAPAMNSAAAAGRRQEELSARIERASTLLRTRVDIALEEQNQELLVALDRRSQTALRIQLAVEGLSVAAITYYTVSLIDYLVRPLTHVWHGLDTDWIVAGFVPVVALIAWRALERAFRGLHD